MSIFNKTKNPDDSEPEANPSSQNPQDEADPATSFGSDFEPLEIEGLVTLDDGAGADDDAPGDGAGAPASGLLSRDQFFALFVSGFGISGAITGLASLPVNDNDPAARGASDAIYDTALETPALRFLIETQNKWIERAMVVAAFVMPKARAVADEIRERRAMAWADGAGVAGDDDEAANDNGTRVDLAGEFSE